MLKRASYSAKTRAIVLALVSLSLITLGALGNFSQSHHIAILSPPTSAPFDHIVTILMENQAMCSVYVGCGGSGTYESQLADQNTLVMTWGTTNHNSEPNYIALFGAINDGNTSGDGVCCYFEPGQNIVDKMEAAGVAWTAFAEDAGNSGTCSFSPPRSGDHFGFIDFQDMNTAARCAHFQTTASSSDPEFLAALNAPNPSNFIWLTPNDNDNGHDSGVSGADSYLAALVPKILASTEFTTTRATLLILYDEGYNQCANTGGTGECVYASFSGPAAKKALQISPPNASHYSYAATLEAAWGLSSINSNDAGAPNMLSAFNPACTANCPLTTSFTFQPSSPIINTPVTFTATSTGGTAPYSITWNFGDGSTGSGSSITHTFTGAQPYKVTENATDSSSPRQTATNTQSITIYTSLPLSITSFQESSPTIQIGQQVTFSATATGGTSPYTYTIDFGDGNTLTGNSVSHVYTVAGSCTATLTVTDSASPQASASKSITINVQALIPPTLAVLANQTMTAGSWINFTLTASSANIGGTITLSASGLPSGASFDQTSGDFSWKPSSNQIGTYVIIFTATDNSDPSQPTSEPMQIQVNQAAPGGSNGGNGGSGGSSNGGCSFCGLIPRTTGTLTLLVVGGLLGLVFSLTLLTFRARANLARTKKRLGV